MLQDAAAATRAKKEETSELEGVTIIAPAITRKTPPPTHTHTQFGVQISPSLPIASEVALNPVFPDFSSVKVEDLFRRLVSIYIK